MLKNKQHLLGLMRSAVERYNMINEGDKIAVGVSGGKDSLALLCLLYELQKFYPRRFSVTALTIDPCFGEPMDFSGVESLCRKLEIKYIIERKPFGKILLGEKKGARPCSLCAKLRRGCLHNMTREQGCNKLALGHHQDDAAETFLMNLLNGGNAACFSPVTHMSRKDIYVIRPLIFASEREVAAFAGNNRLPVVKSTCPVDGETERARIKALIARLSEDYGALPGKLTGALQRGNISRW